MTIDLFAGAPVTDYAAALEWYERLFGSPPSFVPHETEAVWELAAHRFVYIVQLPEHAGHARHTLFVDDLDARVAQVAERGLTPAEWETYANGVRKATYRDPDGNEIGFGGAPPRLPVLLVAPATTAGPSAPYQPLASRIRSPRPAGHMVAPSADRGPQPSRAAF